MNLKSVNPFPFDDYMLNNRHLNRSKSKSPSKNPYNSQPTQVSFAQLSKQISRPSSVKKGLFRIEIEKSKIKNQQLKNKQQNPYFLGKGYNQLNKSPSKLLNLKNYVSQARSKSPQKLAIKFDLGVSGRQRRPLQTIDHNLEKSKDSVRTASQQQKFRISFTSLTKNYNKCSTTSGASNQSSFKQNISLISNVKQSFKHSTNIEQSKSASMKILPHIQPQLSSITIKQSLNKQVLKNSLKCSIVSLQQNDEVNVSVSDSMGILNLDMNPYLI